MTGDEWDGLSLFIEAWWPGEFTDLTAEAWRGALGDFDREVVFVALKACLARGDRWRPAVSEIIAEIRRDPDWPTFAEAVESIYGPGGVLGARTLIHKAVWAAGERDRLNDEAAWDRAASVDRRVHTLPGRARKD